MGLAMMRNSTVISCRGVRGRERPSAYCKPPRSLCLYLCCWDNYSPVRASLLSGQLLELAYPMMNSKYVHITLWTCTLGVVSGRGHNILCVHSSNLAGISLIHLCCVFQYGKLQKFWWYKNCSRYFKGKRIIDVQIMYFLCPYVNFDCACKWEVCDMSSFVCHVLPCLL